MSFNIYFRRKWYFYNYTQYDLTKYLHVICARIYSQGSLIKISARGNKEIHIILESDFGHVGDFMVETQLNR